MIPFVPNPPTPLPAQDLKYTNYHQFHPLVSYSPVILILGNISNPFRTNDYYVNSPDRNFASAFASIIV